MKLVEQHARDARQFWIIQNHARENALGHDLDAGARGNARFHAHAQADGLANRLAQCIGHARGGRARGEPARLQQDQLLARRPRRVEQGQRNARRLAGAGRRDEHGGDARGQRG